MIRSVRWQCRRSAALEFDGTLGHITNPVERKKLRMLFRGKKTFRESKSLISKVTISAVLVVCILFSGIASEESVSAASCSRVGSTTTANGVTFACAKVARRLVWIKVASTKKVLPKVSSLSLPGVASNQNCSQQVEPFESESFRSVCYPISLASNDVRFVHLSVGPQSLTDPHIRNTAIGVSASLPDAGINMPVGIANSKMLAADRQSVACAITSSYRLACWGDPMGLLPLESARDFPNPFSASVLGELPLVSQVEIDDSGICALALEGHVMCWGWSIGIGFGPREFIVKSPTKISQIKGAIDISLEDSTGCAVTRKGEVWCWGENLGGVMGTGAKQQSEYLKTYAPQRVPGIKTAVKVFAMGNGGACAVLRDQQLRCWGGLVGANSKPRKLLNFAKARLISDSHGPNTCLVDIRGDVWCWGDNKYGSSGFAGGISVSTPTLVVGPRDVIDLSMGFGTCALERSGAVWCWGSLAIAGIDSTSPTKIATIADAVDLVGVDWGVCVLTKLNEVACMGKYGSMFGDANGAPDSDTRLAQCIGVRVNSRCAYEPYKVLLPK